ncbi:hypothetical protein EDD17DRAFT_1426428, partial [Pisolithus thermaeus]
YGVCSPTSEGIYTADPVHPAVRCIPVRDTHIADTGSLGALLDFWRPSLNVSFIDPKSIIRLGLAGTSPLHIFVDAHAHILSYGSVKLSICPVSPRNKVLERLVDFVKALPDILNDPSNWIRGMGWEHAIW